MAKNEVFVILLELYIIRVLHTRILYTILTSTLRFFSATLSKGRNCIE